jgi:RHS repeat-associated protein
MPATMVDTVEFKYNGYGQRVGITEKHGDTVLTDKTYLWVKGAIAEERNENGMTVSKRYLGQGFQIASGDNQGNYYYSKDHLGSIREMTNAAGAVVAKYDYDLWGRQTKLSGAMDSDFGFTGFYVSRSTGLDLTWFRAYNPEMGRWLSRDLKGEFENVRYSYVLSNPVQFIDIWGLCLNTPTPTPSPRPRPTMTDNEVKADQFANDLNSDIGYGASAAGLGGGYGAVIVGAAIGILIPDVMGRDPIVQTFTPSPTPTITPTPSPGTPTPTSTNTTTPSPTPSP